MSLQARHLYEFGPFRLDTRRRLLSRDGRPVPLTPKLFQTLLALIVNSGQVVTKEDLISQVWPDAIIEEHGLTQNIFLLRKALGEDADGHPYIETIPKVGYRFVAPVTEVDDQGPALLVEKTDRARALQTAEEEIVPQEGATVAAPAAPQAFIPARDRKSGAGWGTAWVALAAVALLAGLMAAVAYVRSANQPTRSEALAGVRSIAVLPFKPLGADASDEYLGLGMADTLITKLSNIGQITVRPTSAIRRYAGQDADALAAGREQKVEAVLEGSIQRAGERIRLTVRLLHVRDGAPLWSYKCDELSTDIFAVQDAISEKVAEALTLELTGEERKRLAKHYTENTEAYQLYLQGRYFWNKRSGEGFRKALDYFHQAIEKDPNYALAYVGVADSYTMLADYDLLPPKAAAAQAKAAATRALEIDDTLAEAHT
ncbi:MAG TPA: winged helix-turn-helix domain-containing protein, partial [Blastocatellia bacterium]|nr:winged helix-turn-helix domain-containing protein [Blastocatellia bacterium]